MKYHYRIINGKLKKRWVWNIFAEIYDAYYLRKRGLKTEIRKEKDGFHTYIS